MRHKTGEIEIIIYESVSDYTDQRDYQRFNRIYARHKQKNIIMKRYSVKQDKDIVKQNEDLSRLIHCAGIDILPATYMNGKIAKIESYPTLKEVRTWISNALLFDSEV